MWSLIKYFHQINSWTLEWRNQACHERLRLQVDLIYEEFPSAKTCSNLGKSRSFI